jgi:O-antigen/teichoic acid export membrane protein
VILLTDISGPAWSPALLDLDYSGAIRLGVVWALPQAVVGACLGLLLAQDRLGAYACVVLINTVGAQALGLVAIYSWNGGITSYLASLAGGSAFAAIVALVATRPTFSGLRNVSAIRNGFRTGLPLIPHLVSMYLLTAGDRLVIQRVAGLDAAGRYQIAYTFGALTVTLLLAINNSWGPVIHGATDERRWIVLAEIRDLVYRISFCACGCVALTAPVLLPLAVGGDYDPASLAPTTAVISLSAMPYVAYLVHVRVLVHERRMARLVWSTALVAGINFAANIPLVARFGIFAAACTTVACYCVLALLVRQRSRQMAAIPGNRRLAARCWIGAASIIVLACVVPATWPWMLVRSLGVALLVAQLVRTVVTPSRRAQGRPDLSATGSGPETLSGDSAPRSQASVSEV